MIECLLKGWENVKYGGAQIAWVSVVFGFELAIENTRQAFAGILAKVATGLSYVPGLGGASVQLQKRAEALRATAGTARDAYNAKLAILRLARAEMLLEVQTIKMIADSAAALATLDGRQKRLAAFAKTFTDTRAKLGEQVIANELQDPGRAQTQGTTPTERTRP